MTYAQLVQRQEVVGEARAAVTREARSQQGRRLTVPLDASNVSYELTSLSCLRRLRIGVSKLLGASTELAQQLSSQRPTPSGV